MKLVIGYIINFDPAKQTVDIKLPDGPIYRNIFLDQPPQFQMGPVPSKFENNRPVYIGSIALLAMSPPDFIKIIKIWAGWPDTDYRLASNPDDGLTQVPKTLPKYQHAIGEGEVHIMAGIMGVFETGTPGGDLYLNNQGDTFLRSGSSFSALTLLANGTVDLLGKEFTIQDEWHKFTTTLDGTLTFKKSSKLTINVPDDKKIFTFTTELDKSGNLAVDSQADIDINNLGNIGVTNTKGISINTSASITLEATNDVTIKVGSNTITVKNDGNILIENSNGNIKIDPTGIISLNGGQIPTDGIITMQSICPFTGTLHIDGSAVCAAAKTKS